MIRMTLGRGSHLLEELCKTGNQLLAAADNVQPAFVLMLFEHFIEAAFKLCHLQCSPVAQWSLLALFKISSEIGK
jgi:hypothetical protein